MRDPWWWVFRVMALTQVGCAQTILFTIKLLTIERRDDYQVWVWDSGGFVPDDPLSPFVPSSCDHT